MIPLKHLKGQTGQTMIDVGVAMALMALAVGSAGTLATTAARVGGEAGRRTQATALATRELEALRSYRDTQQATTWPFQAGCQFYTMRQQGEDWQAVPVSPSGSNYPRDYLQAYTAADEASSPNFTAASEGFSRVIKMCSGRDFDVNSQAYLPTVNTNPNVKNVEVIVRWEEGNGSRDVKFHTVLTKWSQP